MRSCTECNGNFIKGRHTTESRIGKHTVETRCIEYEKCTTCGYYELDFAQASLIELYTVLALLSEAKDLDPCVFKYARKTLGLTQKQLATKLGLTTSIVQFHENGISRSRSIIANDSSYPFAQYRMALTGLCAIAERELRHKKYGVIEE